MIFAVLERRLLQWRETEANFCFGERELTFHVRYMLSPFRMSVCLSVGLSVCRLAVTFVPPTQQVELFNNFSAQFGTLAIHWHSRKILRRSSLGNPSVGGFKCKRGSEIIAIFYLCNAVSPKRCNIWGKLVLITNTKSYMSFRLVPNSVTLNDLERRNGPYFALFLPNLVISGAYCVKVVDKDITVDNLRLVCL